MRQACLAEDAVDVLLHDCIPMHLRLGLFLLLSCYFYDKQDFVTD